MKEKTRVLVIGDGCKDVFKYGKCDRLSPEAPVPVFKPFRDKSNGGMAVNVYNNLRALGVEADIITDSGATKTRYVDEVSNQMLLRVDEDDEVNEITIAELEAINLSQYDAIVISDYNKGFLDIEDIDYLADNHPLVFMDTKKKIGDWALGIEFIKINQKEYDNNVPDTFQYEYAGDMIVTRGKDGAELLSDDDNLVRVEKFEIEEEHPVRDLSGAGDTFLAALVADYIKNNDIRKAIKFANKCAAWVVTQKGVVVVDLNKIKI
jgi:D-beta-D-heptose 7-phosphate kinase/D-beta-D-heptose 1-phosphate adenosyltransferase